MKKLILLIGALACITSRAQNNNLLQGNDLPNKQVENVLPGGHVLHVRLNNAWKTLEDTEALSMSFLSKEVFPPQMQELLEKENPLLVQKNILIYVAQLHQFTFTTIQKCPEFQQVKQFKKLSSAQASQRKSYR